MSLGIVQDNGDTKVSIDESRIRDKRATSASEKKRESGGRVTW